MLCEDESAERSESGSMSDRAEDRSRARCDLGARDQQQLASGLIINELAAHPTIARTPVTVSSSTCLVPERRDGNGPVSVQAAPQRAPGRMLDEGQAARGLGRDE